MNVNVGDRLSGIGYRSSVGTPGTYGVRSIPRLADYRKPITDYRAAPRAAPLPACFPDARNHPEQRQLAETDSAEAEAAQEGA
jgi:hypothetical protein